MTDLLASGPARKSKLWQWAGALLPLLLALLAFKALQRELAAHTVTEVTQAMRAVPAWQMVLAVILTAGSFIALSGYDVLAQVYVKKTLPYRQTLPIATIAFALGNALGFNALTGGLVRLRLYRREGLHAADIARITAFNVLTFWAGLGVAGGLALGLGHLRWPPRAPAWLPSPHFAGLALLLFVLAYALAGYFWSGRTLLRGARIAVPPMRLGLSQAVVGGVEWLAAATVLWVLLPWGAAGYGTVLGVFVVSMLLGLLSTVPGGLGVFETSALFFLGHALGVPKVLGVLLVYRIIYTLGPFVFALGLWAYREWRRQDSEKKPKRT